MDDLISRQAAIDALEEPCKVPDTWSDEYAVGERQQWEKDVKSLKALPSAQPDLSEYSDRLWRNAYERGKKEAQRTGRWIWDDEGYHCSECFYHAYGNTSEVMLGDFKFCPNCGAEMRGEQDG